MSDQFLPDLSPSARAMAGNQSIIERSIGAFLTQRSDELAAAAGREDWNEVQRISLQLAEESRAQGYRGEFRVVGSFLELRGLERDSLPEGAVAGDDIRRVLEDGTVVSCIPGEFCRWFQSADEEESISVVTQDLSLIAWPGFRGLAANVHLRGRYGTDSFWPRSSQDLEAITAYVSYDRSDFRFRGRIWR